VNRTNARDGKSAIDRIVTVAEENKGRLEADLVQILSATDLADDVADVQRVLDKAIRKYVGNVRYKARRIARTEGVRISQDALERTWEQVPDLFTGYLWNSALLPQTRVDHAGRDGTRYIRKGDGNYVAENGNYAGEVFPGIPLGPNCLCWTEPILLDEPSGIDYGTYNQAQARARGEIEAQSKEEKGEKVPDKTRKAAKKKVAPKPKKEEPKAVQSLVPKPPEELDTKLLRDIERLKAQGGTSKKAVDGLNRRLKQLGVTSSKQRAAIRDEILSVRKDKKRAEFLRQISKNKKAKAEWDAYAKKNRFIYSGEHKEKLSAISDKLAIVADTEFTHPGSSYFRYENARIRVSDHRAVWSGSNADLYIDPRNIDTVTTDQILADARKIRKPRNES